MRAFVSASSSRVWPGVCLAPAVITTTCEPSTTARSSPPLTRASVNCVPWARSSTSASTFAAATSYSATSLADPRMSAA